jgi:hypothetical protein
LAAPHVRTYEGGAEQTFLSSIVFRASYFHNEFGRADRVRRPDLIPELLPGLTRPQQQQLEQILQADLRL